MKRNLKKYSKFLSYILRHRPDELGLEMSRSGWVSVPALLEGLAERDGSWSREVLEQVVRENDKQRFEFDDTGHLIRARQGHTVDVDLGYDPTEPPELLYHGTVPKFLDAIVAEGLEPKERHHVHLSHDIKTAMQVGNRRGKPVILVIEAREMWDDGHEFFCTPNDVWLVESVPPEYLRVDSSI
ncbi:RNA 2'-phosphotransferase [Persicimonas caeni]|uniref:Probable RNA 2'-phosphotransferase n=1 Tax=Persicimonas caeni TaxID=2292766 RepID=A0A4Y6PPB1_PERCE|nr:RNA 2'-phosphotransferase [Persicimonas caeni]QDG50043.1 RNA 2'-phosphotransferase [Persicimonas caeni]QED31264.1 RNA 2'-phosphotransferase [Persicimonas caeni]